MPELQMLDFDNLVLRYSFAFGVGYSIRFLEDLINELHSKLWLALFLVYIGLSVVINYRILDLLPLYAQLCVDVFIGLIMVRKIPNIDVVLKWIFIVGSLSIAVNYAFQEEFSFLETVQNYEAGTVRVFGLFGDSFPFFLILAGIRLYGDSRLWVLLALVISFLINSFGALILGLTFTGLKYFKTKPPNGMASPLAINALYVVCLILLTNVYDGVKSQALSLRLDTILFALNQLGPNSLLYSGYGVFSFIDKPPGIFANVTNQYVQWIFELGIIGLFLALLVFRESLYKGSGMMSTWIFLGLFSFTWLVPGYFIVTLIMLIYEKEGGPFYNYN